ncbi:dimethyladenosine transferase 2, mitochondrial isoform X2 [Dasypus novemcinctus]|uniref:dimethyladenosine transferase 2, mitochondrial isoform X2 n=1 Tax=Dasypus novemcinctus TaxID=9361 RepID=UPI00062A8230|nr:dimethyladenosine transferase 2, mitochondrial isoform X2 [Dasypus novemcinctus]
MWGPMAALPARLTRSALAGPGRFCTLGSGTASRKDLPLVSRRGLSDSLPQPLPSPDFGESYPKPQTKSLLKKRYVTSRRLAETLVQLLQRKRKKSLPLFLECNPGPGILTQALLETGARVVALESDRTFIPHLESLGKHFSGQLQVVHCDFFKLDLNVCQPVRPPVMASQMLFQNLGIKAHPWSAGVPLKVVGIFPSKSERKALWKLLYDLYSCTSIYGYGRIELNMFISEKHCQEPWSSFDVYTQNGQLRKPKHKESEQIQQNLSFLQMTPRKSLFTENLTPANFDAFFCMLKQCFVRRNAMVKDHLCSLSMVDVMDVLMQAGKKDTVKIINMYPKDFKRLFEIIECSKDYTYKWVCNDHMEE